MTPGSDLRDALIEAFSVDNAPVSIGHVLDDVDEEDAPTVLADYVLKIIKDWTASPMSPRKALIDGLRETWVRPEEIKDDVDFSIFRGDWVATAAEHAIAKLIGGESSPPSPPA